MPEVNAESNDATADISLVLAHLRNQVGDMAQANAVQSAIIHAQKEEIGQLKSMVEAMGQELSSRTATKPPATTTRKKANK